MWLLLPVSTVHAVSGVVLPGVVSPGAQISIDLIDCAAGTTTAVIDVGPVGGTPFAEASAAVTDGSASLSVRVPIDAAAGDYVVRVMCKDDDATTIDTAELPFRVAVLGLQLSPSTGPVGTRFTVTGSGCPVGLTSLAFVWIEGASDDVPMWDPTRTGTGAEPNPDGSFSVRVTVPATAPTGENLVTAWCVSEGGSALAGPFLNTFVVTEGQGGGTGGGTGEIPDTGSSTVVILSLAAALLAAGTVLRSAARRRPVS